MCTLAPACEPKAKGVEDDERDEVLDPLVAKKDLPRSTIERERGHDQRAHYRPRPERHEESHRFSIELKVRRSDSDDLDFGCDAHRLESQEAAKEAGTDQHQGANDETPVHEPASERNHADRNFAAH